MPLELIPNANVRLEPHPSAREQAISTNRLSPGSLILSDLSLATVLLPSEKGRRCDMCHCLSSKQLLRKCTGCAAYWYCDAKCQLAQWRVHHKRICKNYNKFIGSVAYQSLPSHEKLEAELLSHMLAVYISSTIASAEKETYVAFMSLLPGPAQNMDHPPTCPLPGVSNDFKQELYSRFGNNNFDIHSHLVSFAHGIFPIASRLFNHSCEPNAAAKYIISPLQPVRMEVVALREICEGEQICITYLDPALLQSRQKILQLTYGFTCTCPSCEFMDHIIDPDHLGESENPEVDRLLCDFVFPSEVFQSDILAKPTFDSVPASLHPAFQEPYIARLSELFSRSSHEGPYNTAFDAGVSLLALYVLIYPSNYPQIGMHLLEMAKTAWNAVVNGGSAFSDQELMHQVRGALNMSESILGVLGIEGDQGGPLEEMQMLRRLLERG